MTKRFGFTLAEVLITLGIIGVVAAMTMPTLMNSTNGAQYKTAYKKALSVLSQAVVLNVALDDYDLSQTTAATEDDNASLYNLFKNRMNVVKTQGNAYTAKATGSGTATATTVEFGSDDNYTLYFNDGITFTFPQNASQCTAGNKTQDVAANGTDAAPGKCYGVIDVNGEKNPNRIVNCDGKAWNAGGENCLVSNPTDIYPVVMYDQTVLPATRAAENVLYGANN